MTEKQLQQAILDLSRICGWLCYHTYRSTNSQPGFPDLCMVRRDRLVFAELKSEKGKLTAAQKDWISRLDRTEAEVYVWYPTHWQQGLIDRVLE